MLQEQIRRIALSVVARVRGWKQKARVRGGYKAFVSYKHEGSSFPDILETAIKRYAKPWLAPPMRIFRDEKYIVPSPNLPGLIDAALAASEYLILLASPAASQSPWVRSELDQWCRVLGRSDRLIIVWLSGTIECDAVRKVVVWEASTALPDILRPYCPQLPFFLDFTTLAAAEQLTLEDPLFRKQINLIVATLRDIEPAKMIDTAILEHRRNIRLRNYAVISLAVLTVLSMAASVLAVKQREEARRQAATAISRQLAVQSSELVNARGDLPLAALLAAEARMRDPRTSEAFNAANRVLQLLPAQKDLTIGHAIDTAEFSEAGSRLLVGASKTLELWDTSLLKQTPLAWGNVGVKPTSVLNSSATPDKTTSIEMTAHGEYVVSINASNGHPHVVDSGPAGAIVNVLDADEGKSARPLVTLQLDTSAQISFDHELMAVADYGGVGIWTLEQPTPHRVATIALSRYVSISDDLLRYPPPGYFAFGPRPTDARSPWMTLAAGALGRITTWRFDPVHHKIGDSPISVISHAGTSGIELSASADYLLTWSTDNTASVWQQGTEVLRVAHEPRLLAASFGKDNDVWTADAGGTVRRSRLPCRYEIRSELGSIRGVSNEVVALPSGDDRFLELASVDPCTEKSVDIRAARNLAVWSRGNVARAAQYSELGIRVVDLASGNVLLDLPFAKLHRDDVTGAYEQRIGNAIFSPDGSQLVLFEEKSHQAYGWEIGSGRELILGRVKPGRYLFFTDDGERLGTILQDGRIAIGRTKSAMIDKEIPWSIEQERKPSRVSGIKCPAEPYASDMCGFETRFAFSPNGRFLAEQEPEVRVWKVDAETGNESIFTGETLAGLGFAYGADAYVAVTDAGQVEILNLDGVVTSTRPPLPRAQRIALSPATPYVAVAAGAFLHVIDARRPSYEQVLALPHKEARRILFSPDGQLLAMGDSAGAMRMWQLADLKWQEAASVEYGASVESLAFGPGNEFMMIGIEDSATRSQSIHKLLVSQTAQVDEICRRLGERRFHPDECLRFLDQDHCPALCGPTRLPSVDRP